jgi:hypothetical protein
MINIVETKMVRFSFGTSTDELDDGHLCGNKFEVEAKSFEVRIQYWMKLHGDGEV